jgi:hypothetical protein
MVRIRLGFLVHTFNDGPTANPRIREQSDLAHLERGLTCGFEGRQRLAEVNKTVGSTRNESELSGSERAGNRVCEIGQCDAFIGPGDCPPCERIALSENGDAVWPFVGFNGSNDFQLQKVNDSDCSIGRRVHNRRLPVGRDAQVQREVPDFEPRSRG